MKTLIENLCGKLESWGIDPIRLMKAIGIFLVIVILVTLLLIYPIFLLVIMIALACVMVISMIYSALK